MHRRRTTATIAGLVTAGVATFLGTALLVAVPAVAGCAATMTATGTGATLSLHPGHVTVTSGQCVTLANATNPGIAVEFHVSGGFDKTVAAGSSTAYDATSAGNHSVTASDQLGASTSGTITVRKVSPSPSPSPSPSRTRTRTSSPGPSRSPRPTNSPTTSAPPPPSAPPPTSPAARPTPAPTSAPPHPSLTPAPVTLPTPPLPSLFPSPSSSPLVSAGSVEPPTGRGAGLALALAAVCIVGTGAGLVRTLLAEPLLPVDDGRSVGRRL